MDKPLKFPKTKEIQQLILESVQKSDLFDSDKLRDFTVVILDMYMKKGDGLKSFMKNYDIDSSDMDIYFKKTISDRYDEDIYKDLLQTIGDENV